MLSAFTSLFDWKQPADHFHQSSIPLESSDCHAQALPQRLHLYVKKTQKNAEVKESNRLSLKALGNWHLRVLLTQTSGCNICSNQDWCFSMFEFCNTRSESIFSLSSTHQILAEIGETLTIQNPVPLLLTFISMNAHRWPPENTELKLTQEHSSGGFISQNPKDWATGKFQSGHCN